MIRKQEATGKTVDEARAKACALLGVQADDLNVSCEVLEMPQKTGFLGLKLTPAKVCVSVEEPDAPVAAPAEPVVEKKTPVQEAVKAAPAGQTITKTISITGLMCGHCENTVKNALEAIPGVEECVASHEKANAIVTLSKDVPNDTLKKAIETCGYVVNSIN